MTRVPDIGTNLLRGRSIFLSASVPSLDRSEVYRRVPDAARDIEEAVISLARAVFTSGGRLVFGGHPTIAPLVALVAGEYTTPEVVEREWERPRDTQEERRAPIQIYQSRFFEEVIPKETTMMVALGYAEVVWTASRGNLDDDLRSMRIRMIQDAAPIAMVCIGGMEGVEREVELFAELRRGSPVYALERTGGAASLLEDEFPDLVTVFDRAVLEGLADGRRRQEYRREPEFVPYPLIAQLLVRDAADHA